MKQDLLNVLCGYYLNNPDQITSDIYTYFNKEMIVLLKSVNQGNVDKLPQTYKTKIEQFKIDFDLYKSKTKDFSVQKLLLEIKEEKLKYKCFGLIDESFFKYRPNEYMVSDFKQYNYYLTGGFQKKTWIGIEGKTGTGKTTMMLSFTADLLKKGHNVCYINLEMNEESLAYLLFSSITGIDYNYIKDNYYQETCKNQIITKLNEMNLGNFRQILNADFNKLSIKELEEIILLEEEKIGIKFDVIIIDYLYLLSTAETGFKAEQGYEKQMRLSQDAHKLAQRNNWCVISVFQKNRQGDTAGAFAAQFDMDYYFTFERMEEQDLVKVTPVKTRGFDGKKESFFLQYDPTHRIYKEAKKPFDSYTWRNVIDLPIVQDNLCPNDIMKLCEKYGIKAPTKKDISCYKTQNNYTLQRGKSKIDYNDIDLKSLLNELSEKTSGNNPYSKVIISAIDDETKDLFKI